MTTTRDPGARRSPGRRDELIQAAVRVAAREGVSSTTTRKIADESGLPLGTVHYWFASKEQLLEEVLAVTINRLESAITEARATATEDMHPIEELRAAWRSVAEDDPAAQLAIYELTCLAVRTPSMRSLAERQYALYRDVAARTIERWSEKAGLSSTITSRHACETLLAASFDGLMLAWLADPDGTDIDGALALLGESIESWTRAPASPPVR